MKRLLCACLCGLLPSQPAIAQVTALEVASIVGKWETAKEGDGTLVSFDGTAPQPAIADGVFPLAAVRGVEKFTGGTLEVQFKLVSGKTDQTAGIVFNLKPNGDYHYVRFNTKDGNVALWKFSGKRSVLQHGAVHRQLPLGVWHTLRVRIAGAKVTGEVVGTPLTVEGTLDAPVDGRIGFWTKPDCHSAFKNLRIQ